MLIRFSGLLLLAWSVTGLAGTSAEPHEFFDERTGTTVTVVHDPLLFPMELSSTAAQGWQDFVSLTAVQLDRSGVIQLYLVAFDWSPDKRLSQPITLILSEREMELVPLTEYPSDLPEDRKLLAVFSNMNRAAYRVTREMLAQIAASKQVKLKMNGPPTRAEKAFGPPELWKGGKAFGEFVSVISTYH